MDVARLYNQNRTRCEWIVPCCGIDFGKVLVVGDSDIFGQAVNRASYLGEDVATQWEVLLSKPALASCPENSFDWLEDESKQFVRLIGWL
jgi:class 3 adenylate cyclase